MGNLQVNLNQIISRHNSINNNIEQKKIDECSDFERETNPRVKWFWNSHNDSGTIRDEWTKYTLEENDIIEKAYREKKLRVELKNYIIDFEAMIQFHKTEQWRVRTIKREFVSEKFSEILPEPKKAKTLDLITNMKHPELLINCIKRNESILWCILNQRCNNNMWNEESEKNILVGRILEEVIEIKHKEAFKRLISARNNIKDFKNACFFIYTCPDIFKKINKILRENDKSTKNFLNYMSFLNYILREDPDLNRWQKTVYRGTSLNKEDIEKYQEIWKSDYPAFQWNSFISTSKNRDVAKFFAKNILFVINFYESTFGVDIEEYSVFPHEEEVLIPASSVFKIETILETGDLIEIKLLKIDRKFQNTLKTLDDDYNIKTDDHRERRIIRELLQAERDEKKLFEFKRINHSCVIILFKGPSGTPYENGMFQLTLAFSVNHPFTPPKCKFDTPIWHPNISSKTGNICIDILQEGWTPVLIFRGIVHSIISLLSDPNFKDPFDIIVAESNLVDPLNYEKIARDWVKKYAQIKDSI